MPETTRRRSGSGRVAVTIAVLLLFLVACGEDDGAEVRDLTESDESDSSSDSDSASSADSVSESSSASGSGSASASATEISEEDGAQSTDNPLITEAVDGYQSYLQVQIVDMQAETKLFADAVRDGDIEAAKATYPISRRPWERIAPIAGLIEDIDRAVDSTEDDFDGPEDPDFTGWHRLEYHLWTLEDVSEAGPFADQLEADLQTLAGTAETLELAPGVLTVGTQELIEEVAAPDGKLSGEEDRYSGTDLYDFKANIEGSEALVELLAPALEEADPDLLATIRGQFEELNAQLSQLGSFEDGFVHYDEVTDEQKSEFAATLGPLAESLSLLNGTLDLA